MTVKANILVFSNALISSALRRSRIHRGRNKWKTSSHRTINFATEITKTGKIGPAFPGEAKWMRWTGGFSYQWRWWLGWNSRFLFRQGWQGRLMIYTQQKWNNNGFPFDMHMQKGEKAPKSLTFKAYETSYYNMINALTFWPSLSDEENNYINWLFQKLYHCLDLQLRDHIRLFLRICKEHYQPDYCLFQLR